MPIAEYINNIINESFYGGELEIAMASSIYNINIATFEERNIGENFLGLSFIRYFNVSNDNNKNLMILSNINNNHFRLSYEKTNNINQNELNFKINNNKELDSIFNLIDKNLGELMKLIFVNHHF